MTKFLKRRAEKLNLLNLPRTILYASAGKARIWGAVLEIYSTFIPDTAIVIRKYLQSLDRGTEIAISRASRKKEIYILNSYIGVFVEVECRMSGANVRKGSNHILRINIYTDEEKYIKGIANAINDHFANGVLANINWDKMKKIFKIDRERVIASWEAIL
ncbi:MAG: hypothetical protein ACFFBZ_15440 [Promethearchaeota archaeon]